MMTRLLANRPLALLQRAVFAAVFLSAAPSPVCAQRATAAVAPAATPQAAPAPLSEQRADETRNQLNEILREHPPAVREVLQREPTLLGNADYLSPYPRLAAFIAAHPEIQRSPAFFLGETSRHEPDPPGVRLWRELLSMISIGAVMLGAVLGFGWLVKTALDHRRWQRVSKVQVETHTKLLDRMNTAEDLRAYMESPAGRQFLESAPIALDGRAAPLAAPVNRILWSLQVGTVVLLLGIAMQFVGRNQVDDVAQPLQVLGVLAVAIGAGFLISAGLAYGLSRKLGLLRDVNAQPTGAPTTWPQA